MSLRDVQGNNESLFRSAEMSLIQLFIPSEVAHATVTELGQLGNVQFKDLNPDVTPFQRSFVSDIRRIDEMERRIRFLYNQMDKQSVSVRPLESALPFVNLSDQDNQRGPQLIENLSVRLREHEDRLAQMNDSYDQLQKRLLELEEARHVLRETAVFFEQAEGRHEATRSSFEDDANAPLLDDVEARGLGSQREEGGGYGTIDLEFVAGTIDRSRMATFERILWRVLRGNLYMNYAEIEEPFNDPTKEEPIRKNVFIIFAHGNELLTKIRKISESMGGTLYPIDSNADKREESLREVTDRIEDLNNVLYSTSATRRTELVKVAETLSAWSDVTRKEKLIFGTMNLFNYDPNRKTLIAEGWCPTSALGSIHLALERATEQAGTSVSAVLQVLKTNEKPPTYHLTNKFSSGFQSLIDAYGVATYQEVNPGLFTVITFPFLFAVMFGDIGHGTIMFLSALAMILYEKKLAKGLDEITNMFFYGRYIILMMGLFSVFTGLMYNDIFSKSMHLFKSGWDWPRDSGGKDLKAIPNGSVYPVGLDPLWHGASNQLLFTNSLKMKMSVILGVLHMSFSLCLVIPNSIHFKRPVMFIGEFLPKMIFLQSIFGYLVFTIIYKWSIDWYETDANGTVFRNNPPGLLNMLIYMFLKPGQVEKKEELYPFQGLVQSLLLLIAFVCIPWMLAVKPYAEYKEHQQRQGQGYHAVGNEGAERPDIYRDEEDDEEGEGHTVQQQSGGHSQGNGNAHGSEGDDEHGEFVLGEVIIHQVIETIEFVLGTISQTASYLRLWALSLAHAQLSEVAWTMTINNVFGIGGITGVIAAVLGFAVWISLSIAVLVLMEGLSAFLHALRLHWVEGCSKHYMATGYAFHPLTFEMEE